MKIFENTKKNNIRTVKFLNCELYVVKRTQTTREQFFFNGIIKIFRTIEKKPFRTEKNVMLFNSPVLKVINNEGFIKKYIRNKLILEFDSNKYFCKKYLKNIPAQYDGVYVLNGNSGEMYLFLSYIAKEYINQNNTKNPYFIVTKKYHIDLLQMLMPDIPYSYLKNFDRQVFHENDSIKINNRCLYLIFPVEHYKNVENNLKNKESSHYFYEIIKRLNIKEEQLTYNKLSVSDEVVSSAIKKVKKAGLNIENFVFIAPYAYSCEHYSSNFWIELAKQINELGMDTFLNVDKKDKASLKSAYFKTSELSYREMFAIAKMSKHIICLRSGLAELATQTNVPMSVIYTKFRKRVVLDELNADLITSGFTLNKLPFIDNTNLREYNTTQLSQEEILSNIIASLQTQKELV